MPVYLDEVPDKAPKIKRPDSRKWAILLVLLLIVGCTLSILFWTGEKRGLIFWFTAIGIPICIWGGLFGGRRIAYKADQVWAESWNSDRNALWHNEITRGQRSAWLIASGIITQAGGRADKILSAITSLSPIAVVQKTREGRSLIRHSKLAGFEKPSQRKEFTEAVKTLIAQLEPVLKQMPGNVECFWVADFDTPNISDVKKLVSDILLSETGRTFTLFHGNGFDALDCWLDNAWCKPSLLLALSAEIRDTPRENEGEAITLSLMLNRQHPGIPEAVQLHRPEKYKNDSLTKTLTRALLWGQLSPQDIQGSWITGQALSQGGEWPAACEENQLALKMTENNKNIDDFIGYVGVSAPWLAVAISALAARGGSAQLIGVETNMNDVWIASVTPGDKSGIRKDML